jgi:Na+/H+-dicarboxylate symporter
MMEHSSHVSSLCSSFPIQVNEEEASLFDILYLLLASVIFVPLFQKIPGGEIYILILFVHGMVQQNQ